MEGADGIEILHDWMWYADAKKWALHCRLRVDVSPDSPIPTTTDWYVAVDPIYPSGSIRFYPARDGGITKTFAHQLFNRAGDDELPWRTGQICVSSDVRILGRHPDDSEPLDTDNRLLWNFGRALDWLAAASKNELVRKGDPFELPDFPAGTSFGSLAFSEDAASFAKWQNIDECAGTVDLARTKLGVYFVKYFYSSVRNVLLTSGWGACLKDDDVMTVSGIWLRLDGPPVLPPWQTPTNFGELRQVGKSQAVDVDTLMRIGAGQIRDGKRHLLLIGFPIPFRIGERASRIHWQALLLPALSWGTQTRKGFRANPEGYQRRDRSVVLLNDTPLDWLTSENWSKEQISTRGQLAESLTEKKVLLVGAGALGSALAELLVRGGVDRLTIIDHEPFTVGNLVRHTLGRTDIGLNKAIALAHRLNGASPHACVFAVPTAFPPPDEASAAKCKDCDIVIDCTGSDEILHAIEAFPWGSAKRFFSLSFGYRARRLFSFSAHSDTFPRAAFSEILAPALEVDYADYPPGHEMPREGIGCWHPVFPARADDVWILAAAAEKYVESVVTECPAAPELVIFEQDFLDGVFVGIRRINQPAKVAQLHE